MKRLLSFQRLFALVLLLAVTSLSWAFGTKIDGIYYILNDDSMTASVTYTGTTHYPSSYPNNINPDNLYYKGDITIPSTVTVTYTENNRIYYKYYSVTSIGQYAFYCCKELTSVIIPISVKSIGYEAFYYCTGLTSVIIPNSVTSIGRSAFDNCSLLRSVTIPNSVTSIGDYAFQGCESLTSATIPNSVTSIGAYAFNMCSGLTSITIPNSVTSIGEYAFLCCTSVETVNSNILDIRKTTLGQNLFNGIPANAKLNVPKGQRQYYAKKSQFDAFRFINEKETVKINIISKLSNGKIYRLEPEDAHRGIIFTRNDAEYLDACGGTYNNPDVEINDTEPNQQFAIYNYNGRYYLYSIGQHKFVSNYETVGNNVFFKLNSTPKQTITISPSSVEDEFIFIVGNKEWINVTRSTYGCVGNWEIEDGGNRISIIEVEDISLNILQEIKQALGEPTSILGDANGNGEVEIGDITSVLSLMANPDATGYNNKAADANKNGVIEIGDVTTILTIMASGE